MEVLGVLEVEAFGILQVKVFGVLNVVVSMLETEVFGVFEGSRDDHGRRISRILSPAGKDVEYFKWCWK